MSDEMQAVLDEVAPGLKDAPKKETPERSSPSSSDEGREERRERPEHFDDGDYENEEDPNFDPEKEPVEKKKLWPKKYNNAYVQQKNENTRLRNELAAELQRKAGEQKSDLAQAAEGGASKEPAATVFSKEQQAKIDAALSKKPKLEDFKDYGDFIEKLMEWTNDVRDVQRDLKTEIHTAEQATARERDAFIAENETRIVKQAKELIAKHPEYLELVEKSADILNSFDRLPHVRAAFLNAKHPELAFVVLAQTEGALQALGRMNATQAALYVGQAEAIGAQRIAAQEGGDNAEAETTHEEPEPQRSRAPTPMKAAKGVSTGKKALKDMDADELDKVLNFSEM